MTRVAWVPAALPGIVSWHAGIIALGVVIATGVFRLLAEWQRRTTLIALVRSAPPETMVHQDDKDVGDSLLVLIGDGVPQQPGVPVELEP
jgi:hypothetical protein